MDRHDDKRDLGAQACYGMRLDLTRGVCTDTFNGMCIDMRTDMCIDMCIDMSTFICIDMRQEDSVLEIAKTCAWTCVQACV